MERLLDVMTGLSLALFALVLVSLRRAHIRVEYSVSWLVAAVLLLVLSRLRGLLDWVAGILGVPDKPMALLFIAFSVFLMVFYRFSVVISNLKDHNIALAQRVAILEFHLRSLHEEKQEP
ncbi:MAG: DUF2304 domain-containing protein [Acidobacteria bacterium]|nr:DUF2304 domain-containing protein [Acidobacteriota bacterium]